MLISVENRFVFVANTKTASTSIEHALWPHADIFRGGTSDRKHLPLREIYPTYDFLFSQPEHLPDSYFKFGVMRHPVEWISSWYRYRKGDKVDSPLPEDMDFESFWRKRDWNIIWHDGLRNLQRRMFCDTNGDVLADVIIPYYRLEEMLGQICTGLKIDAVLPKKNVSTIKWHTVVPPEMRSEVEAFYAEDFELWRRLEALNARGMEKFWDTFAKA